MRINNSIWFLLITFLMVSCVPSHTVHRVPAGYSYGILSGKHIGYSRPIVISSELAYNNSFTEQNYHSVDRQMTTDAFVRDFGVIIREKQLPWIFVGENIHALLEKNYGSQLGEIESVSQDVQTELKKHSIDFFVMIYGVKMVHDQSVGASENGGQNHEIVGTHIQKRLQYLCSIFDVATTKTVFFATIENRQNGESFSFMPDAIDALFSEILHSK